MLVRPIPSPPLIFLALLSAGTDTKIINMTRTLRRSPQEIYWDLAIGAWPSQAQSAKGVRDYLISTQTACRSEGQLPAFSSQVHPPSSRTTSPDPRSESLEIMTKAGMSLGSDSLCQRARGQGLGYQITLH